VTSSANLRRLSAISAYLWLAVSFALFLIAFLTALLSPAALVYGVLGTAALIFAAIALTRPSQLAFLVSTMGGLLLTLAGLTALSQPSLLPVGLVLALTAASLAATVASAAGARLSS
jgi:hypothetical protein